LTSDFSFLSLLKDHGTITQRKAENLPWLFSPLPDLPHQGGGDKFSLPWWEGLREEKRRIKWRLPFYRF
jgi:hypothetical protein